MRPIFRYYGGKSHLVRWLSRYVPYAAGYCEPFAGAASLLFHRRPSRLEYLNDLDGAVVNFYRVMRDEGKSRRLLDMLGWTAYSRSECDLASEMLRRGSYLDDVEMAWAFFVAQNQGFSSLARVRRLSWSRARIIGDDFEGSCCKPLTFASSVESLGWFRDRLRNVHIECRDALELIPWLDHPDMVFYVDPPYLHDTRSESSLVGYCVEMSEGQHRALLEVLRGCRGAVALSGYPSELYDSLGWRVVTKKCVASASPVSFGSNRQVRTECLWMNRRCEEMLSSFSAGDLFS